jgi:predicted dehydrogenase
MRFAHIGVIHPHSSGWRSCLLHMPEVDVVAYYDPHPDAARERLPEYERATPLYDDVSALLRKEQPEAVMITLPNDAPPLGTHVARRVGSWPVCP